MESGDAKTSFCKTNADCGSKKCGPEGLCLCTQDADCGAYGQCNIQEGVCIPNLCQTDADCSDHGTCMALYSEPWRGGFCVCQNGWSRAKSGALGHPCVVPPKASCATDKDCGNYGTYGKCQAGFCNCQLNDDVAKSWDLTLGGTNCQIQCDADDACGFAGTCDPETRICKCRQGWSGLQCHVPPETNECLTQQDCNWQGGAAGDSAQGNCVSNQCVCTALWSGNRCQTFSSGGHSTSKDAWRKWMETIGQLFLMAQFPKQYMLGSLFMGDYSVAASILVFEIPNILKGISDGMGKLIDEMMASGVSELIERQIMSMIASEFMAQMGSTLGLEAAQLALKLVVSVTDVVFEVLSPLQILGMALDMVDLAGYNTEMNNDILELFRLQLYKTIASSPAAIKASLAYPFEVYVTQTQAYQQAFKTGYKEQFQDFVEEYLAALKVNSDGLPILYSGYTPPVNKTEVYTKVVWTAAAGGIVAVVGLLTFVNVLAYKKYATSKAGSSKGSFYGIFFASLVVFFGGLGLALYFLLKPKAEKSPVSAGAQGQFDLLQKAPAEYPHTLLPPGNYTLQNNLGSYLTATPKGLQLTPRDRQATGGVFQYTPDQTLRVPGGLFWNPSGAGSSSPVTQTSSQPIRVELTQDGYVYFPTLVAGGAFAGYVGNSLTWKTSQWKIDSTARDYAPVVGPTSTSTPPEVSSGGGSYPHTQYRKGYGPTATDILNAMRYAKGKVLKTFCLADPLNYQYVPTPAVGYVCPEPLECSEGTCKFTEAGCANKSYLNYWECTRQANRVCADQCDPSQPGVPQDCYPGMPKASKCRSDAECGNKKFPKCDPDLKTCVDEKGHTARQAAHLDSLFLQWDEANQVCNADVPAFKKWCELTGTRKGYRVCSQDDSISCISDEDCKHSAGTGTTTVDAGPCINNRQGIIRPPNMFYNYGKDNRCYTTKTYCAAFETSFGKSKNYVVVEDCNTTGNEVDVTADCCVKLGQSIGEFYLGKTITRTAIRIFGGTTLLPPKSTEGKQFVDHRLVNQEKVLQKDAVAGMDAALFSWNARALEEFGLSGVFVGFSEQNLRIAFPELLETSPAGYVLLNLNLTKPSAADKNRIMLDIMTRNSKDFLDIIMTSLEKKKKETRNQKPGTSSGL